MFASYRPKQSYSTRMPEIVDDWPPKGRERRRDSSRSPSEATSQPPHHAPTVASNTWSGKHNTFQIRAPPSAGQQDTATQRQRLPSKDGELTDSCGNGRRKRRKQHASEGDTAAPLPPKGLERQPDARTIKSEEL